MNNTTKEKCELQLALFESEVKCRDTGWNGQNNNCHQALARDYLVNKNYVPDQIICDGCSHVMILSEDRYRCYRASCRSELSWKNGTIFHNTRIRVNQILMIFARTALFGEQHFDLKKIATEYSVSEDQAKKY